MVLAPTNVPPSTNGFQNNVKERRSSSKNQDPQIPIESDLKWLPKTWNGFTDETLFLNMFPKVVEKVISRADHAELAQVNTWLSKVLELNVPNGKRFRGLATISAYRYFMQNETIDENQFEQICILGWCVELIHAEFMISNNIVDDVKQCRGGPSWHVRENLGPIAFNDAILLTGTMFYILKEYFEDQDYYKDLLNLFHEAQLFLALGWGLERKTNVKTEINCLNPNRHEAIIKYRVSYFTYYLPAALALSLAGIRNKAVFLELKTSCFKIGYLYQIVQDQKHCFTDVANGSLSWFLFQAVRKANRNQREAIRDSYNSKDDKKDNIILEIYKEMNLDALCSSEITELRDEVTQDIGQIADSEQKILVKPLTHLLNLIN